MTLYKRGLMVICGMSLIHRCYMSDVEDSDVAVRLYKFHTVCRVHIDQPTSQNAKFHGGFLITCQISRKIHT